MVASFPIRLNALPITGGAAAGVVATALFAFLPAGVLDDLVTASGLSSLIAAARPPLGVTARVLAATGAGLAASAVVWAALFLLFGPGGVFAREGGRDGMPEVRCADAHPDAPPRKPFSAADFAAPEPVEQPLPCDLDQPLAAFDPAAIPDEPRQPIRAVPPLVRAAPLAPGERIDSFEISSRHAAETGAPSIEALLARLERGARARQRYSRAV